MIRQRLLAQSLIFYLGKKLRWVERPSAADVQSTKVNSTIFTSFLQAFH